MEYLDVDIVFIKVGFFLNGGFEGVEVWYLVFNDVSEKVDGKVLIVLIWFYGSYLFLVFIRLCGFNC